MEQFEQLLTCAICLDRYRNPKLLPCQHSFCMEPCMDGLVDYVRRQVKCPECRAEHRIPYQGVQGYPTNVTLQRFLELHIEITGELPDPTSGQVMERCNVCSEKAYCTPCMHCEKKICPDCKGAHMDILRREISRINNQIRRALHRLQDMLAIVEKNMLSLQGNCSSVSEEIDEIYRRLSKALKDRTEFLRGEIDRYMTTEVRNLSTLKENLDVEISNIQSNCDLADKHINEDVDWDDAELMDAKEIFLRTVEFIRNFECETTDYNRRVRFAMAHDPNQLVLHVAGYGELTINMPSQLSANAAPPVMGSGSGQNLLQPPGPGLMRSKSDHRLTAQFRQQDDRGYDRYGESGEEAPAPRKFGERLNRQNQYGSDRYGRQQDYPEFESPYDNEPRTRGGYRSRFRRDRDNDSDNDSNQTRAVRFTEPAHKERERVLDTEDATRGPLSGITRLADSPRVMKRIADIGKPKPEPKQPEPKPQPEPPKFLQKKTQRQISEEDEISRIKKQNKAEPSTVPAPEPPERPREETRKTPPAPEAESSEEESEEEEEADEPPEPPSPPKQKTPAPSLGSSNASRRLSSGSSDLHKKAGRSASSDSSTSSESSSSAVKNTGAAYTTEEVKQKMFSRGSLDKGSDSGTSTPRGRLSSTGSDTAKKEPAATKPPFQSRFLNRQTTEKPQTTKEEENEDETESSSESDSDSDEESDGQKRKPATKEMDKTDIGPLLARSAQARDTATRRDSRDEGSTYKSRYGQTADTGNSTNSTTSSTRNRYGQQQEETPRSRYGAKEEDQPRRYGQDKEETSGSRYLNRNRTQQEEEQPKYGGYTSRFLNKSKSSATVSPDEDSDRNSRKYSGSIDDDSKYPSGRSRYTALKDRKNRIARSRSSHNFGNQDDEEEEDLSSPNAYLQSKYGSSGPGSDLSRSRSSHHLKSRESSPDRPGPGTDKDGAALSSWARYLKKCIRKLLKKLPITLSKENNEVNVDESNKEVKDDVQEDVENILLNEKSEADGEKAYYMSSEDYPQAEENVTHEPPQKDNDISQDAPKIPPRKNKYGNRGKDGKDTTSNSTLSSVGAGPSTATSRRLSLGLPLRHNTSSFESSDDDQKNMAGSPTSPTLTTAAGFAAGGSTVRNQYLQKRRQLFKVGSRGSEPGSFTWPRGIAVSSDNSIVVADSSNHRVQVFDSNGIFVKEFGTYGNGEGEFDCLAGVAVNRIGQFIIADRYNHRIQVMDPSGRFLRAFGSQGTGDGRFNYPWGITTDALGFIYVCDKENHRVQVFQSDGTFVGKFGSHGNKPGQLEHPHYIAVSNTNRVIVSDSNNHRVQIFDVNGRVLSSFGSEGSEEGQFKFPRKNNIKQEEDTSSMSQREEFFSCHSNDSFASFERNLSELGQQSLEERVLSFLETSQPSFKLTKDKVISKHDPRRRFSDITPELLRKAQAILKHITAKAKLSRQNSTIFETVPVSSPLRQLISTVNKEKPVKPKVTKPGIRKYHPLNVVLNSGPDLSHILKPETLAIVAESKQSFNYATESLVGSLRHDATASTEGRSSGRPGVHIRGRFREQPDSNLPSRWDVPTSVRMLGIGRRGIQGVGGSSSYEQRQHTSVRPRESPHTSILSYRSRIAPSRSFEAPSLTASPSTSSIHSSRKPSRPTAARSYLQRPRSTIF